MEIRSGNHRGIDIVGIGVAYVWNIYACEIDEHSNENHNPHKTLLVFEKRLSYLAVLATFECSRGPWKKTKL